jgi:hypothetical protein
VRRRGGERERGEGRERGGRIPKPKEFGGKISLAEVHEEEEWEQEEERRDDQVRDLEHGCESRERGRWWGGEGWYLHKRSGDGVDEDIVHVAILLPIEDWSLCKGHRLDSIHLNHTWSHPEEGGGS